MKRIAAILLIIAALIAPCGCKKTDAKYQYAFFDVFDTVTELTVYAASEAAAAFCFVQHNAVYVRMLRSLFKQLHMRKLSVRLVRKPRFPVIMPN